MAQAVFSSTKLQCTFSCYNTFFCLQILFNKEFTDLHGIATVLDLFLVLGAVGTTQIITSSATDTKDLLICFILSPPTFEARTLCFSSTAKLTLTLWHIPGQKLKKCAFNAVRSGKNNTSLSKTAAAKIRSSAYT
jgi:hypothetical protein